MTGKPGEERVWAVLPIKALSGAKERLADVLSPEERAGLAESMARDMLAALTATAGLAGVLVVSNDREVTTLAGKYGVTILGEEGNGLSAAVTMAADHLAGEQVPAMMVIHGDIPLATPADLESLLEVVQTAPSVTIVPCRKEDGTNVMICSPPDAVPFHYGPGSFRAHTRAARDTGIEARIADLPTLALDIDTPEDLKELLHHLDSGEIGTNTQRFLSKLSLGEVL